MGRDKGIKEQIWVKDTMEEEQLNSQLERGFDGGLLTTKTVRFPWVN